MILSADSYDARIFYDSLVTGDHRAPGLAVNLPVRADGTPDPTPDVAVTLQAIEAQTWAFV